MSRSIKFNKENLLTSGVEFVKNYGIEKLNSRDLAKFIGCSTQPIFKNWSSLEEYKNELKVELRKNYTSFINNYVDKEDYLYTISYAYAMYAKTESNIFKALFITELAGSRTPREVLDTKRNRPTIEAMTKQYNITLDQAESIYRDVRFYTHGIATQLCCNSIVLDNLELSKLISNMINKLI